MNVARAYAPVRPTGASVAGPSPRRPPAAAAHPTGARTGWPSWGHRFADVGVHAAERLAALQVPVSPSPAPAPGVTRPSPPPPTASLALTGDTYVDTSTTSEKTIRFNVAVPTALNKREYALVNKVKGFIRRPGGAYGRAMLYGSVVDVNFPSWRVDSVDADPVYWSDSSARWNYVDTPTGFYATDSPGPVDHVIPAGFQAALQFKIGVYRLADLPLTTSGTISAAPIQERNWQFSVAADATTGALSHPAL